MASDDMYVVMYSILSYLYGCMRKGVAPDCERIGAEALGIPQAYWAQVMDELVRHGFVDGVTVVRPWGAPPVVRLSEPRVTMEGVAFAQENSMMARARKFLQDAKSALPGL